MPYNCTVVVVVVVVVGGGGGGGGAAAAAAAVVVVRVHTVMENHGKNCCHGKSWRSLGI